MLPKAANTYLRLSIRAASCQWGGLLSLMKRVDVVVAGERKHRKCTYISTINECQKEIEQRESKDNQSNQTQLSHTSPGAVLDGTLILRGRPWVLTPP